MKFRWIETDYDAGFYVMAVKNDKPGYMKPPVPHKLQYWDSKKKEWVDVDQG